MIGDAPWPRQVAFPVDWRLTQRQARGNGLLTVNASLSVGERDRAAIVPELSKNKK
jgi:hypothetical protein